MESQEKPTESRSTPLLLLRGGTVHLGERTVLHHIDMDVYPQEIVTIIGPNGAGKSTLLAAILGLVPWQSGRVEFHPDLRIGYVPQRLQVDPTMPLPVADFIRLSQPKGTLPLPSELLYTLGCETLLNRPLQALSGGELQRVLLARALVRHPNLLVLDEPTQGMDVVWERALYDFLESLRREQNMSILLVSHDLRFVMAATDRVLCLNQHICCSGTPVAVRSHPEFLALFPAQGQQESTHLETDLAGFGLYQHQRHAQTVPDEVAETRLKGGIKTKTRKKK